MRRSGQDKVGLDLMDGGGSSYLDHKNIIIFFKYFAKSVIDTKFIGLICHKSTSNWKFKTFIMKSLEN